MKLAVNPALLRDVPGWKDAPVPACMGGDPRSLAFCCAPGYALSFGFKCRRDELLAEVGLSQDEFTRVKDEFSAANDWDDDRVCFKSLSYCCMRAGGCPGNRDVVLREKYDGTTGVAGIEHVMRKYFSLKRRLAVALLERCKNVDLVAPFIDHEKDPNNEADA